MVDETKLAPIAEMKGEDDEETELLREMYSRAVEFLEGFSWCGKIESAFFGMGVGGVVAVFFMKIKSPDPKVDESLWVVTGDIPPAYLVTDRAPDPPSALEVYVEEMTKWVEAVRQGKPLTHVIPVNAKPSQINADDLESRLNFFRKNILPSRR